MNNTVYSLLLVGVITVVTVILRFLPFWLFPEGKKTPKFINYLGEVLPYAVMGMLVVYCLRDANVTAYPYGLPYLIAGLLVVVLHVWKRNSLLSIGGGTLCYMALVQFVFK
jgi:branched-subunit amino acid transport protein AzlD